MVAIAGAAVQRKFQQAASANRERKMRASRPLQMPAPFVKRARGVLKNAMDGETRVS
jgi:hypothetical protein